jgi:hypothetical protein
MIAIVNISDESTPNIGVNKYQVRINQNVICEFEHDRHYGGLAQCLRDAANAVDHQETVDLDAKLLELE